MSKKKRNLKNPYAPPPKPHAPSVPTKFSSYLLLNPAFPVEVVYQLLSHKGLSEAMMIVKGTPEDFADNPNIMFRKVDQQVNIH